MFEPDEVDDLVTEEVGGSALFAARFRECAARALLLPRRDPGRRSPLWQQRQRSAQLLEVARTLPELPDRARDRARGAAGRLRRARAGRPAARHRPRAGCGSAQVDTQTPSPFARSLMFGYVAAFLYEGDSPLAERRAAALVPRLRRCWPSCWAGPSCATCSTRRWSPRPRPSCSGWPPDRRARDVEGVADLLRTVGPLTAAEVEQRCVAGERGGRLAGRARRLPGVPSRSVIGGQRLVGGDRGRRPAARRARRARAPGGSRRVHRAGGRPARRPGRPLRPYPRAVHRRRDGRPLGRRASRS